MKIPNGNVEMQDRLYWVSLLEKNYRMVLNVKCFYFHYYKRAAGLSATNILGHYLLVFSCSTSTIFSS